MLQSITWLIWRSPWAIMRDRAAAGNIRSSWWWPQINGTQLLMPHHDKTYDHLPLSSRICSFTMSSLVAVLRIHRYHYNVIKTSKTLSSIHTHTAEFNCLVSQSCDNQSNLVKQSQWNQDTPHPSSASHHKRHCLDLSAACEALVKGHMMPIKTVFVKLEYWLSSQSWFLWVVVFRLHIVASKAQEHSTRHWPKILHLTGHIIWHRVVTEDLPPWLCIHNIMNHLQNHSAVSNHMVQLFIYCKDMFAHRNVTGSKLKQWWF